MKKSKNLRDFSKNNCNKFQSNFKINLNTTQKVSFYWNAPNSIEIDKVVTDYRPTEKKNIMQSSEESSFQISSLLRIFLSEVLPTAISDELCKDLILYSKNPHKTISFSPKCNSKIEIQFQANGQSLGNLNLTN